jgi:hypothetical protein
MFALLVLTLMGCKEPLPTQPDSYLVGVWAGEIDSNPMRMEITNDHGMFEGTLTWEAGDPVHGVQISELNMGAGGSVSISLARFGTRTIVITMKGHRTGNVMEGEFNRLAGDLGLSDRGSWRAEKEPRTPPVLGSWRWIRSIGGIVGWELRPPPSVRITYLKDGLFSHYRNDTLEATTTYTILRERTFMSPVSVDVIHYGDSLRFVPQSFRIDRDTLKLYDQCLDGYYQEYVRIR